MPESTLPDEVREAAAKAMIPGAWEDWRWEYASVGASNITKQDDAQEERKKTARLYVDAVTPILAAHFATEAVRESHSRELHHFETEEENATLRAERDALAAQVEAAKRAAENPGDGLDTHERIRLARVAEILSAPASAVVARLRAEAWDEGEDAGQENGANWDGWRYSGDFPLTNPYRQEAEKPLTFGPSPAESLVVQGEAEK